MRIALVELRHLQSPKRDCDELEYIDKTNSGLRPCRAELWYTRTRFETREGSTHIGRLFSDMDTTIKTNKNNDDPPLFFRLFKQDRFINLGHF